MSSGRIRERSIFNNFSHAQNGKVKKKFSVGDIVLVLQGESVHNQWPMARVIQVFKGSNGYVQSIKLRIGKQEFLMKAIEFWKHLCPKLCY